MRRYLTWGSIAALWVAFIALAWFMSQNGKFGATDFDVYYRAAHLLINGELLYRGTVDMVYLYPPLLAQLLMPLASAFAAETAWAIWFSLNVALLLGVVAVLSRRSRSGRWLWIVTPLFLPALEALYLGQVTILLLALFSGAWLAVQRDRRFLAGMLLALAAWIKVYPAILLVYFLVKRDWRVLGGGVSAALGLGLLQFLISGAAPLIGMIDVLFSLTNSGQSLLIAANASVYGFTSQLFEPYRNVTPLIVSPALYLISRALLTLGLLGGLFYASTHNDDFDRQYGLAVLTALLLSPTLFPAGMAPVLLTFSLLLRRPTKRLIWFCTLACVVLSLYWLYIIGYTGNPPTSALLLSFGFYTLIALWTVNFRLLTRRSAVEARVMVSAQAEGMR